MKQTVKAKVLTINTDQALRSCINSFAIFILHTHALSVDSWRGIDYPTEGYLASKQKEDEDPVFTLPRKYQI